MRDLNDEVTLLIESIIEKGNCFDVPYHSIASRVLRADPANANTDTDKKEEKKDCAYCRGTGTAIPSSPMAPDENLLQVIAANLQEASNLMTILCKRTRELVKAEDQRFFDTHHPSIEGSANTDTDKKEEKKEEDFANVVVEGLGSQYLKREPANVELVQLTRMKIRVAVAIEHMLLATIELEKAQ